MRLVIICIVQTTDALAPPVEDGPEGLPLGADMVQEERFLPRGVGAAPLRRAAAGALFPGRGGVGFLQGQCFNTSNVQLLREGRRSTGQTGAWAGRGEADQIIARARADDQGGAGSVLGRSYGEPPLLSLESGKTPKQRQSEMVAGQAEVIVPSKYLISPADRLLALAVRLDQPRERIGPPDSADGLINVLVKILRPFALPKLSRFCYVFTFGDPSLPRACWF